LLDEAAQRRGRSLLIDQNTTSEVVRVGDPEIGHTLRTFGAAQCAARFERAPGRQQSHQCQRQHRLSAARFTNPSDSPAAMCSDTSFTGRTQPAGVGSSTVSLHTSSKFLIGSSSCQRARLEIPSTQQV
jgi:hypothetical protein